MTVYCMKVLSKSSQRLGGLTGYSETGKPSRNISGSVWIVRRPYIINIGWRQKKRWGLYSSLFKIIFKFHSTRCVHLDLLPNMNTDSFLLALHCIVKRSEKPYKLLCDRGTNFCGGGRELQEAF